MINLLLVPLAAAVSDDQAREITRKLRRQLGYFEPGEVQPREPGPLADFLVKMIQAIIDAYQWVMETGWKFLLPAAVLVLLLLIFLSVRRIRRKRKIALAEHQNSLDIPAAPSRVLNKTAEQWYSEALAAEQLEDFNTATVALYRASLARCLDGRQIAGELSNREIAWKLKNDRKNCFSELYRNSDAVVFGSRTVDGELFRSLHEHYRRVF